jgi:hypothetical protein
VATPNSVGWQQCNLAATTAPTADDDNTLGYSVGSRWHDTTGSASYVCLSAATGAAVWKSTTAAASATIDQAIPFAKVNSKSDSYVTVGCFVFRGSSVMGTPSSIHAIAGVQVASGYSARVYDVTNSQTICEKVQGSESFPSVVDLGSISNVPTGAAVWEFQLKRDGGTGNSDVEAASIDVRF